MGTVAIGCVPQSESIIVTQSKEQPTITLKVSRNYQVKDREDYLIDQDAANTSYTTGGTGHDGSKFSLTTIHDGNKFG